MLIMTIHNPDNQVDLLKKGVSEILPGEKDLALKLKEHKCLRIKFGVDPTNFDLHLGHTVPLRKLKQFQNMEHKIFFLLGTFTAQIGDPSGRPNTRKPLTEEEVMAFSRKYTDQVLNRFLDPENTRVVSNEDWLKAMTFEQVLKLAARTTVARMLERDDFAKRYKKGMPIHLNEFLYPLMQGWDSVVLGAEVEIGETDQRFNMLMGRTLQGREGQTSQVVMLLPLLTGTDGKHKMSKSLNNHIPINSAPLEMFSKTMSIPDEIMIEWFELLTDLTPQEIRKLSSDIDSGNVHPKTAKKKLSEEIVKGLYSPIQAQKAQKEWVRLHEQRNQIPKDIQPFFDDSLPGKLWIVKLIDRARLNLSGNEIRRLIRQGAVRINDVPVQDVNAEIQLYNGLIVSIGKKRFRQLSMN